MIRKHNLATDLLPVLKEKTNKIKILERKLRNLKEHCNDLEQQHSVEIDVLQRIRPHPPSRLIKPKQTLRAKRPLGSTFNRKRTLSTQPMKLEKPIVGPFLRPLNLSENTNNKRDSRRSLKRAVFSKKSHRKHPQISPKTFTPSIIPSIPPADDFHAVNSTQTPTTFKMATPLKTPSDPPLVQLKRVRSSMGKELLLGAIHSDDDSDDGDAESISDASQLGDLDHTAKEPSLPAMGHNELESLFKNMPRTGSHLSGLRTESLRDVFRSQSMFQSSFNRCLEKIENCSIESQRSDNIAIKLTAAVRERVLFKELMNISAKLSMSMSAGSVLEMACVGARSVSRAETVKVYLRESEESEECLLHNINGHSSAYDEKVQLENLSECCEENRVVVSVKNPLALTIAVIECVGPCESGFEPLQQHGVKAVSILTSSALWRAQMFSKISSARKRLDATLDIVKTVNQEIDPEKIISNIMHVANSFVQAKHVLFFKVNMQTRQLIKMDVSSTKPIVDASATRRGSVTQTLALDNSIAGECALSGAPINVLNPEDDPRYNKEQGVLFGESVRSLLCVPVKNNDSEVVAVLQAANKVSGTPFTAEDELLIECVADSAGIALHKTELFTETLRQKRKNEALVKALKAVNSGDEDVDSLIGNILDLGYSVIEADKVSMFLVDEANQELWCRVSKDAKGIRVPFGKGIVGQVAASGKPINLDDAYTDSRFDQSVDRETGYHTKSMLCLPLLDDRDTVVGVIQAINKMTGPAFTPDDEDLLEAVCSEVALVLRRKAMEAAFDEIVQGKKTGPSSTHEGLDSLLADFSHLSFNKGNVSSRAMESSVDSDDDSQSIFGVDISDWAFDCLENSKETNLHACALMFKSLGLVKKFSIPQRILDNFLISIAHHYNDNPYHNFFHAVGVTHVVFKFMQAPSIRESLKPLDMLSLLVAALAHDLDHSGKNNKFEIVTKSSLAIRYNDHSVLENHHGAVLFSILSRDDCNIFVNLSDSEFSFCRSSIIEAILGTDMTFHLEITEKAKGLVISDSDTDRRLFVKVLLHAADLSNPVLPEFGVVKKWAEKVKDEFTEQVLKEKELSLPVSAHMDNLEGEGLPKLQIGFISYVIGPLWNALGEAFPDVFGPYVENMQKNQKEWSDELATWTNTT
eukprot:TRINITY_DN2343_c0_g1_i1.p1 TRINITY_DN2343_c0_g1~~TRINITY_DN2343_c0_g1_i1.p1  ORF type:complete len:1150 (+),score=214.32 TRINITY_DN2343_c0_g1_i1:145-3594(+)